jgi:fructan beta-fructosidase
LNAHRTTKSGKTSFNGIFSIPSMRAPLNVEGNEVTIDLFIDQSSIELLSNGGAMSQTTLVFPSSIYRKAEVTGADATIRVRTLKSIWK